jgi:ribosomal protein S18 acetylase RimI-like enzyme
MNLEILPAAFEDLSEILLLQKECYQSEAELHNEPNIPPMTQDLASIEDELKQGMLFLKGMIDGKIISSVRGFIQEDTCHIGRLIVKKDFENRKFGQTLVNALETHLHKCQRYEIFTGHKSVKNLYLYGKLGYKEFKRQCINNHLTLIYLEKFRTP